MNLFYIIIGVAIVGGIIGYFFSDNDNSKEGQRKEQQWE